MAEKDDDKPAAKSAPAAPKASAKAKDPDLALLAEFEEEDGVDVPSWVGQAALELVKQAEAFLPGRTGAAKKRYARNALLALLMAHDIKQVPNWMETPAKRAIASILIEAAFSLSPFANKAERKVA